MKRNVIIIAVVGIMMLGSTFAFAQRGWHGGGGKWNNGCCMNNGFGPWGGGTASQQISADQAKANVQEYVKNNYSGYKVGEVTTQATPRGFDVYLVKAADASGNKFVFVVAPNGNIRGPILESEHNKMLEYRNNMMNNVPAR